MTPHWLPLVVGGELSAELRDLMSVASGTYAIRRKSDGAVVYVGESSTGNIRRTMLRHFQAPSSFAAQREVVILGDPAAYEIAVWITSRGHRPLPPVEVPGRRKPNESKRIQDLKRRGVPFTTESDQGALDAQAEWLARFRGPDLLNQDDGMAGDGADAAELELENDAADLGEGDDSFAFGANPGEFFSARARSRAAGRDRRASSLRCVRVPTRGKRARLRVVKENPPAVPPPNVAPEKRAENRTPDLWTGRTKLEEGGKGARRDWKGEAERTARELAECRRAPASTPVHAPPLAMPGPAPSPPPPRPEGYGQTDERGQASMFKRNPNGRIMDLELTDLVGSDMSPPFSVSRGNRAKHQNAVVRGTFRGASKAPLVRWEGAGYESTDEKELSSWLVKALGALHEFRFGGAFPVLLPGSTSSTQEEAAFWLRLIAAMPAVEIPLAARPWRGENERTPVDGFAGSVVHLSGFSGRDTWTIALAADEQIARRVALLAELTDYKILLKQLGKKATEAAALKKAEEWTGDPDTRARWIRLAGMLRDVGAELPAIVTREKRTQAAKVEAERAAAAEREATRDRRRWPRFAVGDLITARAVSVFGGELAVVEAASRGSEYANAPPEYHARTIGRGVLYACNEDQGLESAPSEAWRPYVLALVEAGPAHSLAVAELVGKRREVAESLALSGLLKRMPARGRWPDRYVVTSQGSHSLGSFRSADPDFRDDAIEAGRKARASRPAPRAARTVDDAVIALGRFATVKAVRDAGFSDAEILAADKAGEVSLKVGNDPRLLKVADCIVLGGKNYQFVTSNTEPGEAPARPVLSVAKAKGALAPAVETKGKHKGQLRMFNPGDAPPVGMLTELGLLTSIGYDDGRRRTLYWNLKTAPILAYDTRGRLFIVYQSKKVVRPSLPSEMKEYRRTHWGAKGRGDVRGGGRAVGPFLPLGEGTSIQYTTKKGTDRELVNYVHEWGEGGPRTFKRPTLVFHDCRNCAPRCRAAGSFALSGGTYKVTERGIVG